MPHHTPISADDDLNALIRSRYPFPLARSWARAQVPTHDSAQLKARLECLEVTLRFVLLIQLADALYAPGDPTAQLTKALKEARRALTPKPSAQGSTEGSYAHALDLLNSAIAARPGAGFVPALEAWKNTPGALPGSVSEAVDAALKLRNTWAHPVAGSSEQSTQAMNQQLQKHLSVLFEALRPLADYRVAALLKSPRFKGGGVYSGSFVLLVGDASTPTHFERDCAPELYAEGQVYLLHPAGQTLLLSPFMTLPDRALQGSALLFKHFIARSEQIALSTLDGPNLQLLPLESGQKSWPQEVEPQDASPTPSPPPAAPSPQKGLRWGLALGVILGLGALLLAVLLVGGWGLRHLLLTQPLSSTPASLEQAPTPTAAPAPAEEEEPEPAPVDPPRTAEPAPVPEPISVQKLTPASKPRLTPLPQVTPPARSKLVRPRRYPAGELRRDDGSVR